MENEATAPQGAAPPPPAAGGDDRGRDHGIDHELLDGWKLVAEGFRATHESLVSELAERFDLGRGPADVLVRLLTAPGQRMPMTRLAHEAGMSSGGFTKLADRLCAADLARRVSCEDDRRVTYLELTDEGQNTAQAMSQAATRILRARVLAPLGRDGFRALTETMRDLRDADKGPRGDETLQGPRG
ncbi:MarR family winged helix-turn-helix transcriptional regulator [Streptomyces sp. NPDC002519]